MPSAQRPAPSAQRPAPSAQHSRLGSPRPDPRPGRRRARLSRFLPVLALLVGAVFLFATPPAQAQQLTIGFCSSEERTIKEGEQVVLAVDITPDLTPDLVRARGIVLPVEIPLTLTPGTSDPGDVRLPGTVVILPPPAEYSSDDIQNLDCGVNNIPDTNNVSFTHVYAAPDADTDDETFTVGLGTLPAGFSTSGSRNMVEFTIKDDDAPPPTYRLPPVTSVTAEPRTGFSTPQLNVSWTAPTGAGSGDISAYRVRWREQGTSDWEHFDIQVAWRTSVTSYMICRI